jgi:hypothetical protein
MASPKSEKTGMLIKTLLDMNPIKASKIALPKIKPKPWKAPARKFLQTICRGLDRYFTYFTNIRSFSTLKLTCAILGDVAFFFGM